MRKADVIQWKLGFEVAERAAREVVRNEGADGARCIALSLELMEVCRSSVSEKGPQWQEEVEQARRAWKKLKAVMTQ